MYHCVIILLFALLQAQHLSFKEYVKEYRKFYAPDEAASREQIFHRRVNEIIHHNSLSTSWRAGINQFTDRTDEELRSMSGTTPAVKRSKEFSLKSDLDRRYPNGDMSPKWTALPTSVDWRDKNVITAVKDQGQCGSCWAFSSTEGIESYYALKYGQLLELSEQQILDCTSNPLHCGGTGGCGGGVEYLAYDSIMDIGGLTTEKEYPYISYYGENETCDRSKIGTKIPILDYIQLTTNHYGDMEYMIANMGPVGISVDASAWSSYQSGIFDGCNKTHPDLNHAVQLVGFGVDPITREEYWIVRNSWSSKWGENGYIRLHKSSNFTCGLDITPGDGDACEGDTTPVTVCGTCGVLYSGIIPLIA